MKRYRRVWTVYRKELIETLRDRRTLIAMIFVPIVLYPVLMVVLVEALKSETGRQEKESYVIGVPDEIHRKWLENVLAREDSQRAARSRDLQESARSNEQEKDTESMDAFRPEIAAEQITIIIAGPNRSLWDMVAHQECHAAVVVDPPPDPEHFADAINRIVQIIHNDTNSSSGVIHRQLSGILQEEVDRIVRQRVKALSGSEAVLSPLRANHLSTTPPDRQFAKALAIILPFLLVTMTLTGAIYPAIDLTAGERERGTLETLAASPVPTGQIVAGKFGVIVTIAMATTTLNLASMTAVIHFSKLDTLFSATGPGAQANDAEAIIHSRPLADTETTASIQRDNLRRRLQIEKAATQRVGFITTAAPIVLLSMIPFAVLFGAVMLAVCSFARTFKEAQNYMMPVMMSAIFPAMIVSYMPTIKLEGAILVIPVANIVVLMRELFLGNYDSGAMSVCLLSTCFYAVVAVAMAVRVYGNEAVLFTDVGSYKTLLLRRFIRPKTRPGAALALLTIAVIFPLNFYAQSSLLSLDAGGLHNQRVIAGTQLFLFAAPVVMLAWYVKLDLRSTFSFRVPRSAHVIAAVLLAISIAPVSNLLQQLQFSWFPPSNTTMRQIAQQQALLFSDVSLWTTLVVFAILPGICEELAFRGFLLAGLRSRLSPLKAVVAVGLIFGLFHIDMMKIPVVSLLGMLLAFVCLRSGSIILAMLVHVANNGFAIAAGKIEMLRNWLGIPGEETDPAMIHFTMKTGLFVALFVVGMIVFATTNRRSGQPDICSEENHLQN